MNKFPQMDEVFASMTTINPATNLPMIDGGISGVDIGGSPFGFDIHDASTHEIPCSFSPAFNDIFGPTI